MKEHFKLTLRKTLGILILLFLFSFIDFFLKYISNPTNYIMNISNVLIGFPLVFYSIENFNILNLIIDIIIFYLIICILSLVFKRRKKENVPNSNSGRGSTSTTNQA